MRRLAFFALLCCSYSVLAEDEKFPWLATLDAGDEVRESGLRLVGLPEGLHALEKAVPDVGELVIGVHGMRSAGYEWVYPLQTIDSAGRHMSFYNWDTTVRRCQLDVVGSLQAAIAVQLEAHPNASSVVVIGHSLGGMVVTQLADAWKLDVPLTIHAVAAPLSFLDGDADAECPRSLPQKQRKDVRIVQWRTQFELDNAFNNMDHNPMAVDIPDSIVVELPGTYRDRRLGHNWSLSYVAERIAAAEINESE